MYDKIKQNIIFKTLASLKLAVFLILCLIILSIWGTVVESLYDVSYAKSQVYDSSLFLVVFVLLFINVLFSTLIRLPFKKQFFGFYLIHLGLLLIIVGAGLTSFLGIDGSITLYPGESSDLLLIDEPQIIVHSFLKETEASETFQIPLPNVVQEYRAPEKVLFQKGDYAFYLERYLPYAKSRFVWRDFEDATQKSVHLMVALTGHGFEKSFTLSDLEFEETQAGLGPLQFAIIPSLDQDCFEKGLEDKKAKYLVAFADSCFVLPELTEEGVFFGDVQIKKKEDQPLLIVSLILPNGFELNFIPEKTSFPVDLKYKQVNLNAKVAFLDLEQYRKNSRVVFLKDMHFAVGQKGGWLFQEYELGRDYVLPWMDFKLKVKRQIENKYPDIEWDVAAPQKGDKGIKRVAKLLIKQITKPENKMTVWVTPDQVQSFSVSENTSFQMMITKKEYKLPFLLKLDHFQIQKNPGTDDPASYESFVKVIENQLETEARIYMNHPLKREQFTFYQSSYLSLEKEGEYASILSANYDPGRLIKYIGSLILVLGSFLYYILKRKQVT